MLPAILKCRPPYLTRLIPNVADFYCRPLLDGGSIPRLRLSPKLPSRLAPTRENSSGTFTVPYQARFRQQGLFLSAVEAKYLMALVVKEHEHLCPAVLSLCLRVSLSSSTDFLAQSTPLCASSVSCVLFFLSLARSLGKIKAATGPLISSPPQLLVPAGKRFWPVLYPFFPFFFPCFLLLFGADFGLEPSIALSRNRSRALDACAPLGCWSFFFFLCQYPTPQPL